MLLRAHTDTWESPKAIDEPTGGWLEFVLADWVAVRPPPANNVPTPSATYTWAVPMSPPALIVRPPPAPYSVALFATVFAADTRVSAAAADRLVTLPAAVTDTSPPPSAP